MSDILIHGIEMPEERQSFQITIKYNGLVFDTETGIQIAEAYELPPHGKLIDADKFVMENYKPYGAIDALALEAIKAAPAIISADK